MTSAFFLCPSLSAAPAPQEVVVWISGWFQSSLRMEMVCDSSVFMNGRA